MYIKRFIYNKLKIEVFEPEIIILLGARQVGKTTILKSLEKFCVSKNLRTKFYDLEQPDILAGFNIDNASIQKKLTFDTDVIFIDEFQYVKNMSKIFKAIFDSKKSIKIFCSGSSSIEIHKHLKESLAGRRFLYNIYPLSFKELNNRLNIKLEDYLQYGGMPGLCKIESNDRKQQILSELLSAYILKDIKFLIKEENLRAFNHLLYLLSENQGQVYSVNSLANKINMSSKAVNKYLDILEATYVNYRISSYSNNLGNELKKSSKSYLYDLGIRNALLKDYSFIQERKDKGAILETFVFLQLKAELKINMEIKFWRTKDGNEVDFIVLKDRKPIPIEVKSNLIKPEVPKGLRIFIKRYSEIKKAFIVNLNLSEKYIENGVVYHFVKFEEFIESFNKSIM